MDQKNESCGKVDVASVDGPIKAHELPELRKGAIMAAARRGSFLTLPDNVKKFAAEHVEKALRCATPEDKAILHSLLQAVKAGDGMACCLANAHTEGKPFAPDRLIDIRWRLDELKDVLWPPPPPPSPAEMAETEEGRREATRYAHEATKKYPCGSREHTTGAALKRLAAVSVNGADPEVVSKTIEVCAYLLECQEADRDPVAGKVPACVRETAQSMTAHQASIDAGVSRQQEAEYARMEARLNR